MIIVFIPFIPPPFQSLWAPIGVLPDPPGFLTWWSHHTGSVQIFSEHLIDGFITHHPSEIWAQTLNLADQLSASYELMAPWFSGHNLHLHHATFHIYIATLFLCQSRCDLYAQPGTTVLDHLLNDQIREAVEQSRYGHAVQLRSASMTMENWLHHQSIVGLVCLSLE